MIYKKKIKIKVFYKKKYFYKKICFINFFFLNYFYKVININIIYINLLEIYFLNKLYKNKNNITDILIFNYKKNISDIYINYLFFYKKNIRKNLELFLHSILHSQGFTHKIKKKYIIMKSIENKIIKNLPV